MNFNFNGEKPIYLQIAEQLEDSIFTGIYAEETQIPSTTELSVGLQINPATVLKGMNILVFEGTIYKKRGLGMFVSSGAVDRIREKRQKSFYESYIYPLISEAEKLGLEKEDVKKLIERGYENEH